MAGSYPDVPSRRMAHDDDGSIMAHRFSSGSQALIEFSAGNHTLANNEGLDGWTIGGGSQGTVYVYTIFPELREVDGIQLLGHGANAFSSVHTSGDSTNTWDGTFTQRIASYDDAQYDLLAWREKITSMAVSNVRMVRATYDSTGSSKVMRQYHIYGEISSGETPDRLIFIDELTGLEFALSKDYGDVPRGSSEDIEWRIKNNSATLTANTIQYTSESLTESSGSWYTHTEPGLLVFIATQSVASLAAATTTGLITTRRITPAAEGLSLHGARTYLNTASWT